MSCDNIQSCVCECSDCEKHGKCCECLAYHRSKNNLPACLRVEKIERKFRKGLPENVQ